MGKLAGNRNLAFGVKNTLEEFLQEKGYDLTPSAPYKLKVQIIYLDVLTTKKNISVFHKNVANQILLTQRSLLRLLSLKNYNSYYLKIYLFLCDFYKIYTK